METVLQALSMTIKKDKIGVLKRLGLEALKVFVYSILALNTMKMKKRNKLLKTVLLRRELYQRFFEK